MKSKVLSIVVNRPVKDVWEFTTNPLHTSEWVDFIKAEQSSAWPAHVGATYRNQNINGSESEYKVTAWEPYSRFELTEINDSFSVEYTYQIVSDDQCELRYLETTKDGQLSETFTQDQLVRLKTVMEKRN
jgi:hypothetical protein